MSSTIRSLVSDGKYDEIKTFIKTAKAQGRWKHLIKKDHGYFICDAVRDSILLGHKKIVKLFIKNGVSADSESHKSSNSPFIVPLKYFAGKTGNLAILKLLVENGAKIKENDRRFIGDNNDNQQAMHAAIKGGHADVVQYLLENGGSADGCMLVGVTRLKKRWQTFIGKAAYKGDKRIVDLLIEYGAREIKDSFSRNSDEFKIPYQSYKYKLSKFSDDKKASLEKVLSEAEMEKWNQAKKELLGKRDNLLQNYSNSVQMILDHAMGTNWGEKNSSEFYSNSTLKALTFLKSLDISGFNFVGMSINCTPITREMLVELGLKGADKALVTYNDIINIPEDERRDALTARLENKLQSLGKIISENGIVNLVPLADAAEKGLYDIVKVRLSSSNNPNQRTTVGLGTCLAIEAAARNGYYEVVRLLAEHPGIDQESLLTASEIAKGRGYVEITEYLRSLQDVNTKDSDGDAPIHRAVMKRDIEDIKRLLRKGADINLENSAEWTPLIIALTDRSGFGDILDSSDIALIEFLLENGADTNKYYKTSPLALAAKRGSLKAVQILLPVAEKKNLKQSIGYGDHKKEITMPWYVPPMFNTLSADSSEEWLPILTLLKEHGADFNAKWNEETIWDRLIRNLPCFAHTRKRMNDLLQLIKTKWRPESFQKQYEDLVEKTRNTFTNVLERVDFLLKNGADHRIPCGHFRGTILHELVTKFNVDFIEGATEQLIDCLLEHGIEINTPDKDGFTPLHRAAATDNLSAAAYLIQKGADINACTKEGHTPLHIAAAGNPQITKLLIDAGADIKLKDLEGHTPLVYSRLRCIADNSIFSYPTHPENIKPYHLAQNHLMSAAGKGVVA